MSGADNNRRIYFMSKTIRTKVYSFKELNKAAQQTAIDNYRNNGIDTSYYWDEAHESVKEFHKLFGTNEGNRSWMDVRFDSIDDNILNLKGLRLRTYILNNFGSSLYKGKWAKSWTTDNPVKHRKVKSQLISKENGWHNPDIMGKYYNKYYRLEEDNSCVLTGVCYDESLLQPIYEFLDWKLRPDYNSYMDFETLVNDCFENLRKDLESEDEYRYSDEGVREELQESEQLFTKDGKEFNY